MTLLEVKDLTVRFHTREGEFTAVDDISFTLNKSQTLGIVGESGSGKSVLCYSLLGLLPDTAKVESGQALFDGRDLIHMDHKQIRAIRGNRIAMIFQDPMTCLNPYLTIFSQMIEPLQLHQDMNKADAKSRCIELLDEVGIENSEQVLKDYPHQLSGGMRQRVMIAMALCNEPEILIADEPTTALDVTIQAQILDLMQQLQQKHDIGIIFITHDLGVIAGLADNIIVMEKGNVVESGTAEEVFYQTRHTYTKNLLAAIPQTAKPVEYVNSSDTTSLQVDSLSTWFNVNSQSQITKAVDNVSITVKKGEILGLVGESGSGKSTLGRSIMRLVNIKSGTVKLDNNEISSISLKDLNKLRPQLQMIFQDPYASLNPRLTVFDTLAEALQIVKPLSREQALQQVIALMKETGLESSDIRKYPHEFSGGQRQRIAIARALALSPALIIADEPVSALDVTIQAQILELLLKLSHQHQVSMIFISHDLSVVRYVADRIAVMYKGKIVEVGDTEDVFNKPEHEYTQTLLKAIPVADPEKEKLRLQHYHQQMI